MSGALVPASGVNFQQQGQVDWVSLSKSTFTFALDMLVRLSKAELDPATYAIALITCNRFVIKADAQERIRDALSSLKSFSSYGRLVWFGFGIKPIIKDLADSEHGMACIGLCACMSVSYGSFYVAEVLRELCKISETPSGFVPSVHQWRALVRICAGSVSNSKFPMLLEGLIRLVRPRTEVSLRQPTAKEALAKAIRALADVSNEKLANVTIAGGLDCIWLAAVSEWLLSLDVEIRLSSGLTVYKSSRNSDYCFTAVTIIFVSDNEQPTQLSKCHLVPKGHRFWESPRQDQLIFRGGRSEWTNILADTFGSRLDSLLQGSAQHQFALLLFSASRLAEDCYHYGPMQANLKHGFAEQSLPFGRFHFVHSSSRGHAFLAYAGQCLPELAATVDTLGQFEIQSYNDTTWGNCIDNITLECMCQSCHGEKMSYDDHPPQFCLGLIAETIIILLWMLSATEVDPSLAPSALGLQLLYMKHRENSHYAKATGSRRERQRYTPLACFPANNIDILTAALIVFSGSTDSEPSIEQESSALSHSGVCVFFRALEDLNLVPEEASTVRVVPGHIDFEGAKYQRIRDIVVDNTRIPGHDLGPHISYKLMIQETPQPGFLAAAYKLHCNRRPYEYLLGIARLELAIAKSIEGPIQWGKFCARSFLHQAQEAIVFVPTREAQQENLSDEMLPLLSQWSVVLGSRSGTDKAPKLRVMQATICRLYFEITQQDTIHHLTYLSICHDCTYGCSCSPEFRAQVMWQSPEPYPFFHLSLEGTITITSPFEAGSFTDRSFEIFIAARSSSDSNETSLLDRQNPMLSPLKNENNHNRVGKTALHAAATLGHQGILQLLLQWPVDVNCITVRGETALHWAAGEGHNKVVRMLLRKGAYLELGDKDGQKPLSWAARNGHRTTVNLLARYGAQKNSKDNYGQTSLSWAAAKGHLAVVEQLLQEKADINAAAGHSGRTALQAAAGGGHLAVIKRLLQEKADVNAAAGYSGKTALQAAAGEGHFAVVERLLQEKADVNIAAGHGGRTALQAAAAGGHLAVVERLLQEKADVNATARYSGKTALQAAAAGGHLAVVERLLQEKADVNAAAAGSDGRTALQAAAGEGHFAIVERLLQEKADVNAAAAEYDGRTALQAAAGGGHLAVVERLLQEKADVNAAAAEYDGRTALQAAAGGGHLAVVERLLQEKADVNAAAVGRGGKTALQAAAAGGHLAVVKRLLQEAANVNAAAVGRGGKTALQAAAARGHLAVIECLLQEAVDVNAAAAESDGRTALQAAAEEGHFAVVERLLQEKADVNAAAGYSGKTALQAAAARGHLAVVERLLQEKADVNAAVRRGGRTALQAAAVGGHLAVVERLLQEKADVNTAVGGGRTALEAAAGGDHLAIVERLLQEKADVNAAAVGRGGRTALQAAAAGGHFAVVERLLQEKADVNAIAAESDGRTALQAAAEEGHLAVVELLLKEKADVNAAAVRRGGKTALQAAAAGGHFAVVERLLQEAANVNAAAAKSDGRTALQAAVEGGHLAVVERLLQEKADVNIVRGYGGTLQTAVERGYMTVAESLRQAGAVE
ncbi:hypothetical protein IFR05_014573 [Cadophora sp. M221]|nr:hypothetical protein IFR05_014573 [Cadophora sp. M221]